jgi:hypothetical protein
MAEAKSESLKKTKRLEISLQTMVEKIRVFLLSKKKPFKKNIDLIIMGTKGAAELEKVICGRMAGRGFRRIFGPCLS